MKFLSLILAVMVLGLSCIPCSDDECFAIAKQQTATTPFGIPPTEHNDPSHPEHNDLCSPFCQCSCCAVACTIPSQQVIDILIKPTFPGKVFSDYLPQHPIGISLPVWQPPKLA